ncbi:glycoside hydrolase family 13 protein [Gaertneriomyces semiglobifer]|nr:glycoside hydrolase family 13 protein [Gaertneriomyces semiglobifer]
MSSISSEDHAAAPVPRKQNEGGIIGRLSPSTHVSLDGDLRKYTKSPSIERTVIADEAQLLNNPNERRWWKEAVVYQIYPRSFKDSNGDGIGDIPGIIQELDYLKAIGVDVIWLSPVYKSPMHDMGYDISDYRDIHPEFGTMTDFDNLLAGLHERGIKLVMDLVVNHTSFQHNWFLESKKSKDNPYRDWYFWRPPKFDEKGNRMPPNNWESIFGGSAWTYDEATGEYYLHLFASQQPDLNWDNSEVRESVYDMMHFWLRRGIDGFRMDVINLISKVPGLPDAPIVNPGMPFQPGFEFFVNGPRVHQYMREMNDRVLSHYDIMTVGEMPCGVDPDHAVKYVAADRNELNMVFTFDHMNLDGWPSEKWIYRNWNLTELKNVTEKWQFHLAVNDGWNSLYLENHDQPRSVGRFTSDAPELRDMAARMLATFLSTLRGTLFVYQGQELGLINPKLETIDQYRDIETLRFYDRMAKLRYRVYRPLVDEEWVMLSLKKKSRDNARTPIPWDNTPNGGFTTSSATPWIPLNPDYKTYNANSQLSNPTSVLNYWRHLLALRKNNITLVYGEFMPLDPDNEQVYAYMRKLGDERLWVVLNFTEKIVTFHVPAEVRGGKLLLGSYVSYGKVEERQTDETIELRPYEARIYEL